MDAVPKGSRLWDQPGLLLGLGCEIVLLLLREKRLLLCRQLCCLLLSCLLLRRLLLLGKLLAHPFFLLCL